LQKFLIEKLFKCDFFIDNKRGKRLLRFPALNKNGRKRANFHKLEREQIKFATLSCFKQKWQKKTKFFQAK